MDEFMLEKTFLDITDATGLSANQTKEFDATGVSTSNTNYMSANNVTSSAANGKVVREITSVEIIPPQNADGAYEDLREVVLVLDGKNIEHYFCVPGNGNLLMNPLRTQVIGGPTFQIKLGAPLWKVVGTPGNHALANTTLKYSSTLGLSVSSVYGFTGTGSGGYRIIVKGYEYSQAALAVLGKLWKTPNRLQTLRRQLVGEPALAFDFPIPGGALTLENFTALPGGQNQRGTKVNPYWHFAFNAQATANTTPYAMTNLPALAGASGNVEDSNQDLGLQFNLNNDAFIVQGWGVMPVPLPPNQNGEPGTPGENLARAGWFINGNLVPQETGNAGVFVTAGVDPLAFGAAERFTSQKNVYYPVPRVAGQLLIYKDDAVPFIAGNGSAIPADQVAVGYNGTLVEQ